MKKIMFTALSGMLVFSACKKEDSAELLTGADLLKSGKWQETAYVMTYVVDGKALEPVDRFASYGACEKDDYILFRQDNHMIKDEGSIKCVANSPQQNDLGIWLLTDNNTRLQLAQVTGKVVYEEILQFDQTTFKTKQRTEPVTQNGATTYFIYEHTYKHVN